MRWITGFLFALSNVQFSQQLIITENNAISCVTNILKEYYKPKSDLTVVNLDEDANEMFAALHRLGHNVIYSRTSQRVYEIPYNAGYLIIANSSRKFVENFEYIVHEVTWNPYSKMLILVRHLEYHEMNHIFDILLKEHVINVVLINDTNSTELFTYNPFDNYNCGRRYDRIISLGRCDQMHTVQLYYEKLVTGLQNCSIRVSYSPLPPYVFDPAETNDTGLEQFIFTRIAEAEKFTIDAQYSDDVDEFSTILNNTIAKGPLRALQINKTDVIIGSMLLFAERAQVFTYIAENSETIDYLTVQVAVAQHVSSFENIYLEFRGSVWLALILTFVVFSILIYFAMKKQFSCVILLKLFGFLTLQSNKINGNTKSNTVLIFWIYFAYIINCYYQSSLVSIVANPSKEHQVNSESDIRSHKLRPCICKSVRRIMRSVDKYKFRKNVDQRCDKSIEESIKLVVETRNKYYAISLQSVFEYHETEFYDEDGKLAAHTVDTHISQVVYACYMYKGFPGPDRIQRRYMQLGEAGLILQQFEKLKTDKKKQYGAFKTKNRLSKIFIPWAVLGIGVCLSFIAFILELLKHKLNRCNMKSSIFENIL